MKLSQLVEGIPLSTTLALDARAKALAAEGRDVINMAVGEPDFPAPATVQRAAVARIESGNVRYTPAAGAPEVRATIATHLTETRGTPYGPHEVAVCHSCKHALSGSILALVGPGDEVLIPLPAWVSYFELVRLSGATPVGVPSKDGSAPDFDALEAAVTPRTRLILFNSPANPSGYVWSAAEVQQLMRLAQAHDLALISDEIYRRLVYDGEPAVSPASAGPDARARTVIVDGASKTFAMTGYRVGFLAGPQELVDAVARMHSQTTGAPNTVSQAAFAAALREEPPEVEQMRSRFAARRDVLLAGLEALGLETARPRGAFYAFPSVAPLLDDRGSPGFAEDLLEQQNLAVVPGEAFGVPGHIRLSYAMSRQRLGEALGRLEAFLLARRSA
ncbi:MAG: pyridoxal phosphate-dependent aminotransferase [Planctomycetota bacterium]